MVQLEFVSGALAQFHVSASPFIEQMSSSLAIFGEKGTLYRDPYPGKSGMWLMDQDRWNKPDYSVFVTAAELTPVRPQDLVPGISDHAQTNQMRHFRHCCATGEEPISSGRDNLKTIELVQAIFASSERGEAVRLNE